MVDIIGVLFFQLVSLFVKLGSNFQSFFTEELKVILNYPLEYVKRLEHNSKGSNNVNLSFECIIGLSQVTATHRFLLVPISWYQGIEKGEITEGYRG